MAQRKSAVKTEARERARKAAGEAMAREERLLELGEEFFLAAGEAEQIMETAEQRITEIRAKAARDAAQSREAQARVVVAMKGERVAVSDIAQRLELSAAAVRALLKANKGDDAATSKEADAAEVTAPADSELERETVDA